jgi:uncharacterized phage protein gp47/JayE
VLQSILLVPTLGCAENYHLSMGNATNDVYDLHYASNSVNMFPTL